MQLHFRAVAEADPGPAWQACFARSWPGYQDWFRRQGAAARPSYLDCRQALRSYMPELVPLWQALVDLAGGGDEQARMLSLWCPTPYLTGCSQAVWPGPPAALVRNYDYHPGACEATVLRTAWQGQPVLAMSDCLWGALDGINAHGLCASLSFAGCREVGIGFGIPLLLRWVLQHCADVASAAAALARLPSHMSYHVTLLDAAGRRGRITVAPGRPAEWSEDPVATNHGSQVAWPEHAAMTHTQERAALLRGLVAGRAAVSPLDEEGFARQFLIPPLFQTGYRRGHGTLYTAVYRPTERAVEYRWPDHRWRLGLDAFSEGEVLVCYPG